MPYCQACGKEVALGAQFCPSCGRPISTGVPLTPAYSQPAPVYFPPTSQTPKSNRNLIIIILAIVAVVVIIGAVASYAFFSSVVSQPDIAITNAQMNQPQGQHDSFGNCVGETLTFSLTLVNSGSANGYAKLVLLENNQTQLWNNNYLVDHGQSLPVSASTFRQSCTAFNYNFHIASEWKG